MSWNAHRYRMTHHHNLARSRKGRSNPENIIHLKCFKHELFHQLFGNRTLVEAAEILLRLDRMKKENHEHS
jgi:hypothetical protein